MGKKNITIVNHEAIHRICASHEIGLKSGSPTIVLEDGKHLKVHLLTTRGVGGIGFRSEIKTVEKNPRLGIIRAYKDHAMLEI